ncbi:sensor domain-containing diguanylate cyclase [Orenia marismortui]|uniref:Diguanylate cyclase (GGDEF)-like protein n=1 Tax=Orenia marismortui TaxID=46469 RepID=A0A4R8GM29_9FIRM|nr:diguanylate cyclase [Orenia marismortui]TDX46746.1 diguanylate cyclase (GGDEF)-like protein [Orenia marismortui]
MLRISIFILISLLVPMIISLVSSVINKSKIVKLLMLVGLIMIFISNNILFTDLLNQELGIVAIYIFIILSIILFDTLGGVISLLVSLPVLILSDISVISLTYQILFFLITILFLGRVFNIIQNKLKNSIQLNLKLSSQIKELRGLREVSALLQGTLELDKILHIILSSVTAGSGLEFNRAILFLIAGEDNVLKGNIGIGPLNQEEGLKIWENIAKDKINLEEMIFIQQELEATHIELNDLIQNLVFDLNKDNIATKAIENQESYNIKWMNPDDNFQCELAAKLGMEAFALVPLIVKGNVIGILTVDNIVNQKEITYEDIDSLLPFANQAAIAIQNAKLNKLKEDMVIKDNLTGLYNQRFFQTSIKDKIEECRERETCLALMMIDIDYFKVYNDNNGHPAGNEALKQLSSILASNVRDEDIVCRFGGEEFSIILPNISEELALSIADRIRRKVSESKFKNQETQPKAKVTISVGVAVFPKDASGDRELLNVADEALYYAKLCGRDNVKLYKDYLRDKKK